MEFVQYTGTHEGVENTEFLFSHNLIKDYIVCTCLYKLKGCIVRMACKSEAI